MEKNTIWTKSNFLGSDDNYCILDYQKFKITIAEGHVGYSVV